MTEKKRQFTPFQLKNPRDTKQVVNRLDKLLRFDKDSIWTTTEELYALYEFAFGLHNKPDTKGYVVEFGSYRGGSACVMAKALRDSKAEYKPIFTVDPYFKNAESDYAYMIARANYHRLKVTKLVCPVITGCLDLLDFWTLPIRIAFLDASHKYEHTKAEINAIMPHIVDDGWLICDDYEDGDWTEVVPAVNEFLDTQKEYDLEVSQVNDHVCLHVKRRIR